MNLRYISAPAVGARFAELNVAFSKAGITEKTGHNDGPQIDKLEKVWDMKGEPYCAMGQFWVFAKALLQLNGHDVNEHTAVEQITAAKEFINEHYLRFDPLVATMISTAKRHKMWREFDRSSDVTRIDPGDLVCFNFGTEHKPQNHIEMFHRYDGSEMWNVGWNTTPAKKTPPVPGAATNDPGKGGGCFYKNRPLDVGLITGWIAWQHVRR